MVEKAALIQELDDARQKMQAELVDLDPQMPICPGWTIKHLLAHLIGWDEITTTTLRAYAQGNELATPTARDIHDYNARSVATRALLDYNPVVKEWELARDELKAALLAIPDEKIAKPLMFPWGPTGTIREIVDIFAGHELEHAEELHHLKAQYRRSAPAQ
jgi:uncharacterized protein (TIGR03083 family)